MSNFLTIVLFVFSVSSFATANQGINHVTSQEVKWHLWHVGAYAKMPLMEEPEFLEDREISSESEASQQDVEFFVSEELVHGIDVATDTLF